MGQEHGVIGADGGRQPGGNEGAAAPARDAAREAGHIGKTVAAEELGALAGGIRRSAAEWDGERHAWVKRYLGNAADGLDRFSATLRERDLGTFVADAEAIARRHPALFVACCAAAGFALTRFLRSGGREKA
jgi:hypothetical protein